MQLAFSAVGVKTFSEQTQIDEKNCETRKENAIHVWAYSGRTREVTYPFESWKVCCSCTFYVVGKITV
jgi:hypothetical protein